MASKFSRNLTKAIKASGISKNELANLIGVHPQTIRNWELGNNQPGRSVEHLNLRFELGNFDGELGYWLRAVREGLLKSVSELAAIAKIAPPTIYNIESGVVEQPQSSTVAALRFALNKTDSAGEDDGPKLDPAGELEEPPEPIKPDIDVSEPVVPQQGAAVRYVPNADGKIDIDRGAKLLEEELGLMAVMQGELREAAQELATLTKGSNGYASIAASVEKYRATVDRPVGELTDGDIELLYARILRVKGAYDNLRQEIERGDAPPEDVRLRAPMEVLMSLNGAFLQATVRGRDLYEQTDLDRRTREEDLELKRQQLALNKPLRTEAALTTTANARDEVEAQTQMIADGAHPERASAAGRNTIRNYWIAMADLACRFVRSRTVSAGRVAITVAKIGLGAVVSTVAGKVVATSKIGTTAISTGAAILDITVGGSGAAGAAAFDFMIRHAAELHILANAGGAKFDWLNVFLNWLQAR